MAGTVRSARNLWALLSGNAILSMNLIGQELEKNSDWLLQGVLFYSKPNASSLDKVKVSVDETQFDFITKLSKLTDVDALQCLELFASYIKYEYKGTQKSLKTLLATERHIQSLLCELWNYYYSERLYSLLIMKHILEHWQDDFDHLKDLYADFVQCMDKDKAIIKNIMKQIEQILDLDVPNKDTHGPFMNELLSYQWATFMLKERCELLHLVLLYRRFVKPSPEDVQATFALLQKHGSGLRQPFRQLMNESIQSLVERIRYLEVLVIVQDFQLNLCFRSLENVMEIEHPLLKDESSLKALDSVIQILGSHKSHSPILLCWMLLGQCSNSSHIRNPSKLGNTALQLGVYDYILGLLQSIDSHEKGAISEVVHSVIYDLLCVLLSEFELHTLGNLEPIYGIAECVLRFPKIAEKFWESGIDSSAGILLKHSIDMFPYNFLQLINLAAALAEGGTNSCQKIIRCIKHLPTFTECLENTNRDEIIATSRDSIFRLVRARALYGDPTLVVPEGALGVLIQEAADRGQTIFQWHTHINGWQVILWELNAKLQEISLSIGSVNDESISKLVAVANLVLNMLKNDIGLREALKHIINKLFSILQRFSTHPTPPLNLLSKCIEVVSVLCKDDSSTWQNIVQMNLTPFMISPSNDVTELVSGICMNMGALGQLIASKERIFGRYSLCIAFLKLMVNLSESMLEFDGNFLACVIYILREVFSSFHKWLYLDPQEKLIIGQACLSLLHNLLSIDNVEKKTLTKVPKLCVFSLFHFEAGQTLLKIVCTGEAVIQQTILQQDSEQGEQVTALIRLSLSVLNRLLLLRRLVPEMQKSLPGKSPLENVLFSTPSHSEQPQAVLTIAYYAFQYSKPRLATLAVQLLKRFAKEFPMSLLACFGSEAKAVRNHFLSRLSSLTEDVRLKVSILEFLTVCISQQPGVIEMFINIKEQSKDMEGEGKNKETVKSCLTIVKEIIKLNSEDSSPYNQDLHCVAVEFVHSLWAGHQSLAMEALKKDSEFWPLLCKSILSQDLDSIHPKILAYVIRTLGLEFFYMSSTGYRETVSEGVKQILKQINSMNLLRKWSQHVNSISPQSDFNASRLDILDRSVVDDAQEAFALYTAWRDFLLVLARYETEINLNITAETKLCIMKHILQNITDQILGNNIRLQILLAESYMMLFHHWKTEFPSNSDETFKILQSLLQDVASNADAIHPRVQLALVCVNTGFISMHLNSKDKDSSEFNEWVPHVCKLVRKASTLIDGPFKMEELPSVLKLPTATVCLLNKLILETNDWLPILKTHVTLPLLASLLVKSLKLEVGITLAHAILTLFVSIAATKKAAEALYNTGFMAEITLILSVINLETSSENKVNSSVLSMKKKVTSRCVYFTFLRLVCVLLKSLGNYFLQDALNFVGVHLENLIVTFNQVRKNVVSANLEDAILTCALVHQLSYHHNTWRLEHSHSLDVLLNQVSLCAQTTIALLIKPVLLKHLIECHENPRKNFSNTDLDGARVSRISSTEEDTAPSEKVVHLQNKLFELLAVCLATIQQYSPGLCETISDNRMDQWQLLLHLSFGTPSIDQDSLISFGAVLACVNTCLRWLSKNERTPSPGKGQECTWQVERHLLMYVLEVCLTLVVTQCCLALTHLELSKREKQLLRRELASELNTIMQMVNRYLRRGPLSPASNLSSPNQPKAQQTSPELPYIKLINTLVNQLVK